MCGKQLADTRCGLMILPLLSYVTEQVTARTGTKIRYDHCLLIVQIGQFFRLVFTSFSATSNSLKLPFTSPFSPGTIALSILFQFDCFCKKLVVSSSLSSALLHHLKFQHPNCPACPHHWHPSLCNYCQSLWPELWRQVCDLSLQFLGSILYQTGSEGVLASFCLVVMIIRAMCLAVFLQNN